MPFFIEGGEVTMQYCANCGEDGEFFLYVKAVANSDMPPELRQEL